MNFGLIFPFKLDQKKEVVNLTISFLGLVTIRYMVGFFSGKLSG